MWFVLALTLAFGPAYAGAGQQTTPVEPGGARSALRHGLDVLHDWDSRREAAWAASDPSRLHRLYTPGSSAGRADVRLLRAYAVRGFVVRRLETQVFAVRVLRMTPRRITLRVLDRVAGGVLTSAGKRRPLASTRPALRDVTFQRLGGDWVVSDVSARGPGPRGSRH